MLVFILDALLNWGSNYHHISHQLRYVSIITTSLEIRRVNRDISRSYHTILYLYTYIRSEVCSVTWSDIVKYCLILLNIIDIYEYCGKNFQMRMKHSWPLIYNQVPVLSYNGMVGSVLVLIFRFSNILLRGESQIKNVPKSGKSPQFSWPPLWNFLN